MNPKKINGRNINININKMIMLIMILIRIGPSFRTCDIRRE